MQKLIFIASLLVGFNLVLYSTEIHMPVGKCYDLKKERQLSKDQQQFLKTITDTYNVPADLVTQVLHFAKTYEKKTFPKADDILAIIGIESSWNPKAKSSLAVDPAVGLTQIRPYAWRKFIPNPKELLDVEKQIKYASDILHYNFKLTKSKEDAIVAYNVGYGNWLEGNYDLSYFMKFSNEKERFRR